MSSTSITHYDAQLLWDSTASPSPALGVTTVVIGNCGFGIVPAPPEHRATILANLAEVEGMSLASLEAGVAWTFETFGEYLDVLRKKGVYPNVAALASHATIRTAVMGEEASRREATPAELELMVGMLRDAMDAGAVGFGSSTNENHRGSGGVPIPSRLASEAEYAAFADAMADYDHGVFLITTGNHMRIPFMEEFSRRSRRPALYAAHFHYGHEPDRARQLMLDAQSARGRGHPVYTQGACQPLSLSFTLDAAYILKAIENWPSTADHAELRRVFTDPGFRDRLRAVLRVPDGARVFNGRWDWVLVMRAGRPDHAPLENQTVAQIACERGVDPLDLFLDLALEEDFETVYTFYVLNMDEEGVAELITNDGTLVSLSDAGAHNSLLCDAGYAMHLLSHWVREKGAFDLPSAIRKVTSDPANVYGFLDRGRLTPGAHADMILFDPDTLTVTPMGASLRPARKRGATTSARPRPRGHLGQRHPDLRRGALPRAGPRAGRGADAVLGEEADLGYERRRRDCGGVEGGGRFRLFGGYLELICFSTLGTASRSASQGSPERHQI